MSKTNISVVVFWLLHGPQVTIDVELCLNKKAKLKSSRRPAAKYDVYLYRTPQTRTQVPNGESVTTVSNGPSRTKGRVLRWEDDCYPPSPPCPTCSPIRSQQPKPWTVHPHALWQTVCVPVPADYHRVPMTERLAVVCWILWQELKLWTSVHEHDAAALGSVVLSHLQEISAFIHFNGIFLLILKCRETLNTTTGSWRHHSPPTNYF